MRTGAREEQRPSHCHLNLHSKLLRLLLHSGIAPPLVDHFGQCGTLAVGLRIVVRPAEVLHGTFGAGSPIDIS